MSIDDSSHRRVRARVRFLAAGFALCGLLLAASVGKAADWPEDVPLRGSFPAGPIRWDGVNFGAHIGASVMDTAFGSSNSSQVAYILRNTTIENEFAPSGWTTLPSNITTSASYGGFLGYSVQWAELVLGVDLGYNRLTSMDASASDTISRQFITSDGYNNAVTINATTSVKLVDYATLRGRAGYAIGQFLPYAVLGAAVGRFNYAITTNVITDGIDVSGGGGLPFHTNDTLSVSKDNAYAAGFLAGLGMDVAILPNVFLRGEWEFITFTAISGIRSNIHTARAGVGVRF